MATWTGSGPQVALANEVLHVIDSVTAQGQTEAINRETIYRNLCTGARKLLRTVDDSFALYGTTDGTAAAEAGKASVTVGGTSWLAPLPSDFLRFLEVQIDNWEIKVQTLRSRTSSLYELQANSNSAHDSYKPLAFIVPSPGSPAKFGMQLFPQTDPTDIITSFYYLPDLAPEDMISDLKSAMIFYAAGLTLIQTDQGDRAGAAFTMSGQEITQLRVGFDEENAKPFEIDALGRINPNR